MKTLFLVRHAKSSWDDSTLPDQDRPLNDRGKRDAPRVAKRLAKRGVKIDLIASSPANRAISTARVLAGKLHYALGDIVVDDRLYPGRVDDLLELVHDLDDQWARVMLVGHNPALERLAHRLSREITRMPTCAVAQFTFKTKSWAEAGNATLATAALESPRKR